MNNKIALESLAMDLKRVALGYHRNSLVMAERFYKEALQRKSEVDITIIKPYMKGILSKIDSLTTHTNEEIADEALMLSTLIQNYTLKFI